MGQETNALQPLGEILTPHEFRRYQEKPTYRGHLDVFKTALDRLTGTITGLVHERSLDGIAEALYDLHSLATHGLEEAEAATNPKDFRSKQVKRLEIRLRKLVETLDDLKLAVPFESRMEFEETALRLEMFRDKLLGQLFGSKTPDKPSASLQYPGNSPSVTFVSIHSGAAAGFIQRRARTGVSGDQFTSEEYEKIQDAQELLKRVKAFIEIAESRLVEIHRRIDKVEWDKEEENPLEFYTVAQMVHAYQRAIEGIMVNIDEKAKYKMAKKKEIRKSLELLNKKMQEFIPKLEPLEQLAIDTNDEELDYEVRKAKISSGTALKGSQMGIGAPSNS
jgi:hypothetical protein